jgi:hypothetical protein
MLVRMPPARRVATLGDLSDPLGLSGWRDILGTILGAAGTIISKQGSQTGPPASAQTGSAAYYALQAACVAQLTQGIKSQQCCQFGAQFCPDLITQVPGGYALNTTVPGGAVPFDWAKYMPMMILGMAGIFLLASMRSGK